MKQLDGYFLHPPMTTKKRLVLLFDEAAILLDEHFGVKGFLFQCVCLWLCQAKRDFQCVAVFAGTTFDLCNTYPDSSMPYYHVFRSFGKERTFLRGGVELPPPFYQTTTIGCYVPKKLTEESDTVARTE
jgi:hypothetical protein